MLGTDHYHVSLQFNYNEPNNSNASTTISFANINVYFLARFLAEHRNLHFEIDQRSQF